MSVDVFFKDTHGHFYYLVMGGFTLKTQSVVLNVYDVATTMSNIIFSVADTYCDKNDDAMSDIDFEVSVLLSDYLTRRRVSPYLARLGVDEITRRHIGHPQPDNGHILLQDGRVNCGRLHALVSEWCLDNEIRCGWYSTIIRR